MIITPRDEYDSHEGIRRSSLWLINKSPYHFRYAEDHPKEPKSELQFGIAAHKYILERDTFWDEYVMAIEVNKRTKAGKEEWEAFEANCAKTGKTPISEDDFKTIVEMDAAIDRNPLARQLLTGDHERPFYWTDTKTGELCKCKPDCLTTYEGSPCIVDYKTTRGCDVGQFEHSVREYGYDLQVGMYTDGVFMNTFEEYGFAFVAQEKTEPYAVNVYVCTETFIDQSKQLFHDLLGIYHDCKVNDNWYGYEGPFNMPTILEGRLS